LAGAFDGRWVRALPAALLAGLVAFGVRSVALAALPAFRPVTPEDFLCDNALPDALLAALVAFFAPRVFPGT
jgi:hypothetical protein